MATTEAVVAATPKAANDAGTPPVEEKPSASGGGGADLRLANEPWYHGLLPREDIKVSGVRWMLRITVVVEDYGGFQVYGSFEAHGNC